MSRSLWSGAISFGLLNIPVALMSSKEEEHISFHLLDKRDNSPVGYKQINKATGREITPKNIVKGYEYEKNKYVIVDKDDFLKANPKATQTIDIEDFIDLAELDVLLFDKPYYMVPGKNGEKGYVLLHKVLKETAKVAVAKFVLRNRQHLVAVLAKGDYLILEILRFAHEVQSVEEADFFDDAKMKKVKISAKELQMAKSLVAGMTSKWKPEQYKDTYQDDLLKLIKQKIKTGKVKESVAPEEIEETNTNVIDLMPLLQQSLRKNLGASRSSAAKAKTKVASRASKKSSAKRAHA